MTENKQVRVRFAPSPTGGLHLGGVRTVLYNYLFAKKHNGTFVLRIEDTDQTRFVEGAEAYIYECLDWCGLVPDESPLKGGAFGPYRQSERKPIYKQYAEKLIEAGHAYYAFDTPDELERMRQQFKTAANPSPQYDARVRQQMKNGLTLSAAEVQSLIQAGVPHVIRIKMPTDETITFHDLIHQDVSFDSNVVDDKVLIKADGMPTYHLAVVVDDFLMQISHAFRGEEWLSSAPVHIKLWEYLFGLDKMPQWAHLPLIMGPHGKLSKRDGSKYGFPVFAMNWTDPRSHEFTEGFREKGFLPEAFVNLLAMLGWNDGTGDEILEMDALLERFSIDRVHKSGAQFDYEKARWFNQEWLKKRAPEALLTDVRQVLSRVGIDANDDAYLTTVIGLVRERCVLLSDFIQQAGYFFSPPESIDFDSIRAGWNDAKQAFFREFVNGLSALDAWHVAAIELLFKQYAETHQLKPGSLQLPLRLMLVGGKFGPSVLEIAATIGKKETLQRITHCMQTLNAKS